MVDIVQAIDIVVGADVAGMLAGPEDLIVEGLVANRFIAVHRKG